MGVGFGDLDDLLLQLGVNVADRKPFILHDEQPRIVSRNCMGNTFPFQFEDHHSCVMSYSNNITVGLHGENPKTIMFTSVGM